jgi:TatD DNase family protein
VIVPAYDLASWPQLEELPEHPKVFLALGIHPWVAGESCRDLESKVAELGPRVVAIGEIGLDTKVESPDLPTQREALRVQLDLAVRLDLPVILHCRGAFDELLEGVQAHDGKLRGVLHAFSRSREVAERFIAAGLHLGLGGAITRPTARRVRKAAAELPLDRIVLETDAPSIGLDGVLPADTEPHHVADVAQALSELRGISEAEVARQTTLNAERIFRL